MKIRNRIITGIMTAVMVLGLTVTGVTANAATTEVTQETSPLYRVYNPNGGEHLFLASQDEKAWLVSLGWKDEGIGWYAPGTFNPQTKSWSDTAGLTPIYRVYNPNSGEHIYLEKKSEVDWLVSLGWNYEDICWYTDKEDGEAACLSVYRVYNPNANGAPGSHMYLTDKNGAEWLASLGWNFEGVAFMSGHNNMLTNIKEATCSTDGYTGDHLCAVCNKIHKGKIIPKNNNHVFELKNVVEAACDKEGYSGDEVCKICGYTEKGHTEPGNQHVTHYHEPVYGYETVMAGDDGQHTEENAYFCNICNEPIVVDNTEKSGFKTDYFVLKHLNEAHGYNFDIAFLEPVALEADNDKALAYMYTDAYQNNIDSLPYYGNYVYRGHVAPYETKIYTVLTPGYWDPCERCGKTTTDGKNWY